ncbi:hypothetical protein AAY51_23805, partial [Vibrio parahaemolyticus]
YTGVNALARTLRETTTLNGLISENAAEGVIAIDRQRDVTSINPAAEMITGHTLNELVGRPYATLVSDPHVASPVLDTLAHRTE